jgi:hypothetical protein
VRISFSYLKLSNLIIILYLFTFFLVEIVGSGGPILFLNTDRVGSLYIN